jgi:hypothetical protein
MKGLSHKRGSRGGAAKRGANAAFLEKNRCVSLLRRAAARGFAVFVV